MKRLPNEIVQFFQNQGYVIVSTLDRNGIPHNSCKGIVEIKQDGRVYLLDLYKSATFNNLKRNPRISITAVDEHKFRGYCLKGRAKIIPVEKLKPEILRSWEDKISSRITRRLLKNIREEKGHPRHPEALMPKPKYMVVLTVKEVVDLTPHHLK